MKIQLELCKKWSFTTNFDSSSCWSINIVLYALSTLPCTYCVCVVEYFVAVIVVTPTKYELFWIAAKSIRDHQQAEILNTEGKRAAIVFGWWFQFASLRISMAALIIITVWNATMIGGVGLLI